MSGAYTGKAPHPVFRSASRLTPPLDAFVILIRSLTIVGSNCRLKVSSDRYVGGGVLIQGHASSLVEITRSKLNIFGEHEGTRGVVRLRACLNNRERMPDTIST